MRDGLLIIDKPVGPTSHDVVARARRILSERRIGHTGTLDPLASGVLPLVVGRATRLARFLSASDKTYEAVIRLGFSTDSGDAAGAPIDAACAGPLPDRDHIARALAAFRGTALQQPPKLSAKKIGGVRSHRLARRGLDAAPRPEAVEVTLHAAELLEAQGDTVTVRLVCSAGFYVRALATDLGAALGVGAHLVALRRTRVGDIDIADAVPLAAIDREGGATAALAALIPLNAMLPGLPQLHLTPEGATRALHGQNLDAADFAAGTAPAAGFTRLMDPGGNLLGIGEPAGAAGLLHPAVVLM